MRSVGRLPAFAREKQLGKKRCGLCITCAAPPQQVYVKNGPGWRTSDESSSPKCRSGIPQAGLPLYREQSLHDCWDPQRLAVMNGAGISEVSSALPADQA